MTEEGLGVVRGVAGAVGLGDGERLWLPYCGVGEDYGLMRDVWPEGCVDACDRDRGCVEGFGRRYPGADVRLSLAERYEFGGGGPYRAAWLDAYNSPFRAVRHWLHGARLCGEVGLVLSTQIRSYMVRRGQLYDFAKLGWGRFDAGAMKEQVGSFSACVAGWLGSLEGVSGVEQVGSWSVDGGGWELVAGYVVGVEASGVADGGGVAGAAEWRDVLAGMGVERAAGGEESWSGLVSGMEGER